jgi:c-di-GMP-binding flagellar brake protein YcgR
MISLNACVEKAINPVEGQWVSEYNIMAKLDPNYKEIRLNFSADIMSIDDKKIPIIYKIKKDKVVLFSRGEKITVFLHNQDKDKIVVFLANVGKRVYVRTN